MAYSFCTTSLIIINHYRFDQTMNSLLDEGDERSLDDIYQLVLLGRRGHRQEQIHQVRILSIEVQPEPS